MSKSGSNCPYRECPDTSYWRRAVAGVSADELDPVLQTKFSISRDDKVATAGSCFAQHISRYLANNQFNYHVAEPGHVLLNAQIRQAYNYGTFSCRYGNIYTARQLLQLLQRAEGSFVPEEAPWTSKDKVIDPFRPQIQPEGFATVEEYRQDMAGHLRAVARMTREMDVFIFTLGLTEGWVSLADGAVFPVCPGCGEGSYDPAKYRFVNFDVMQVTDDLNAAIALLRAANPALRIVLTVSPVPLVATFENQHVLTATTYSKSVLRVAAGMVARDKPWVDYFPSYEIITGSYSRGRYFEEDLREVRAEGVAHVMRLFARHYLGITDTATPASPPVTTAGAASANQLAASVVCDEEVLDAVGGHSDSKA